MCSPCANNGVLSRGGCAAGHLLVCRCCLRGGLATALYLFFFFFFWGSFTGEKGDCSRPVVSTVCPLWWCDFCCDLWSVPSCEPSARGGWLGVSPGAGPSIRRLGHRSSQKGGGYSPSAHRAVDHQCLPAEKTCFVLLLLACCRDKEITRNAYHTVEKVYKTGAIIVLTFNGNQCCVFVCILRAVKLP